MDHGDVTLIFIGLGDRLTCYLNADWSSDSGPREQRDPGGQLIER